MQNDFGVGLAGQVVVVVGEQLLAELAVVGQLAVEAEAEPFVFLQMVPLERLGVAEVVGPAGGIPHMPDGGAARVFLHQAFVLAAMAHPKDFGDAADLFVGVDQLIAIGIEDRHAGGELAAVLDVEQHSRDEPRGFFGPLRGAERARFAAGQVIDRGQTAFVIEFAHRRKRPRGKATGGQKRDARHRHEEALPTEVSILRERHSTRNIAISQCAQVAGCGTVCLSYSSPHAPREEFFTRSVKTTLSCQRTLRRSAIGINSAPEPQALRVSSHKFPWRTGGPPC